MKKITSIIIAIFVIGIILLSCYNIKVNGVSSFLNTNVAGIIDLLLTIFIAVFIVNSQSKSTKRNENFCIIIEKFQLNFVDVVENVRNDDKELQKQRILTLIRKSNNQFTVIKKYSKSHSIKKKMNRIDEKLEEFHNILSDHLYDDIDKYRNELNRASETIDNICEEIKIDIYN